MVGCRWAFFLAVDCHGHFATAVRAAAYLVPYYMLATPNAALWQMYLVCVAIIYACTGTGYLLSLVRSPSLSTFKSDVHPPGRQPSQLPVSPLW